MLRLVMPDQEGDPVLAKVPRRLLATDPIGTSSWNAWSAPGW